MTGHRIYARHCGVAAGNRLSIPLIKRCIRAALQCEGVDMPCEISVLITNDSEIRGINNEFRGIDRPTDVLSFPMQEFERPGWTAPGDGAADIETGLLPLGEIILSAERVTEQAREYGQARGRETAYLTVHSTLHLLGYDHIDGTDEKRNMRERENQIMRYLRADSELHGDEEP